VADRDNEDLLLARPVVDSVGKARDCSDPNFAALDTTCQWLLADESKSTAHLLDQSASQPRLLGLVKLGGRSQLLLRFWEKRTDVMSDDVRYRR
jgi:hypothetical protein